MDLRLDLRLRLDGSTEAERELVREIVAVEARKFTARLADALEDEGIEVEIEAIDQAPQARWRRLLRS